MSRLFPDCENSFPVGGDSRNGKCRLHFPHDPHGTDNLFSFIHEQFRGTSGRRASLGKGMRDSTVNGLTARAIYDAWSSHCSASRSDLSGGPGSDSSKVDNWDEELL